MSKREREKEKKTDRQKEKKTGKKRKQERKQASKKEKNKKQQQQQHTTDRPVPRETAKQQRQHSPPEMQPFILHDTKIMYTFFALYRFCAVTCIFYCVQGYHLQSRSPITELPYQCRVRIFTHWLLWPLTRLNLPLCSGILAITALILSGWAFNIPVEECIHRQWQIQKWHDVSLLDASENITERSF